MVHQVNQVLRGWANYFNRPAFQSVHAHACRRVRRWLRKKYAFRGEGYHQYPDRRPMRELGLLNLTSYLRGDSWANA